MVGEVQMVFREAQRSLRDKMQRCQFAASKAYSFVCVVEGFSLTENFSCPTNTSTLEQASTSNTH